MARLILASSSPRRKEILEQAGMDFEVFVVEQKEHSQFLEPEDFVKELALQKAIAVANKIEGKLEEETEEKIILGADTIVVYDHKILGKPRDMEHAFHMLDSLQGKIHQVFTGVAMIILKKGKREEICFAEKTEVKVCHLEPEEIRQYILTGESVDKAGAYAIQGRFCRYIEGIQGDYYNVVGFPISRFCQEIKNKGLFLS